MGQQTLSGGVVGDPVDNPETLRELYHEQGLTLREIGDELGCDYTTVHRRMYEFEIPRRGGGASDNRYGYATFHTREDGYEYWSSKTKSVLVHRLLAVHLYGFDAVCDGIVHHDNRVRWDNRPDNIEVTKSHHDHAKIHYEDEQIAKGDGSAKIPDFV